MLVRNGLFLLFLFIFSSIQLRAQTDSAGNNAPVTNNAVTQKLDTARPKPVVKKKPLSDSARAAAALKQAAAAAQQTNTSAATQQPSGKPANPASATVTTGVTPPGASGRPAPAGTNATLTNAQPANARQAATDTLPQQPKLPLHQETAYDVFLRNLASKNMFLHPNKPQYYDLNTLRPYKDLDWLVYLVGGVVMLLGVIRLSYLKYFSDLFRAFLNPTLSQRQLKDQLSQSPFPNFLLNMFFVISVGLYLYLLMYRQQYIFNADAWLLIPGLIILVALIYGIKFVVLRFCGWLFGNSDLADAYIFILNLINKVLGILLVPFLVILAFCQPEIARAFLYISLFFITLLIGYRYVRAYSVVKQYLSFSKLHFFLYLCAFEVAPVLLLTKVLLIWLTGN
ncbi:DUF4271 domain-containing protein [Chitinophaga agrisoli]|uniref:DUF4271 domain-containing protein n=1 Tax=Chitinophaga agrisoli TaxID=2607653 RepID=A0A5B2W060_9BACT|nr:DUF4271 domain-containing protein [Chitinophaga agrisoli]KAA2244705.1 DUF4271 domain-containing protein [Chitinophaga agrisoli]